MILTADQFGILEHTRDRAPCQLFCGDSDDMKILIGFGLMVSAGEKGVCPDEYFRLTRAGKEKLDNPTQ